MCEPITIATMMVAGAAMSAYGQVKQGQAAKAAGDYQNKVAQNNAAAAELQARDAQEVGAWQQDAINRETAQAQGSGRATLAASGVTLDAGGSAADWETSTIETGMVNKAINQHDTDMKVWALRQQKANYLAEGKLQKFAGINARNAAYWSAGGTLLQGAGAAGMAYNMPSAGAGSGGGGGSSSIGTYNTPSSIKTGGLSSTYGRQF